MTVPVWSHVAWCLVAFFLGYLIRGAKLRGRETMVAHREVVLERHAQQIGYAIRDSANPTSVDAAMRALDAHRAAGVTRQKMLEDMLAAEKARQGRN